MSSKDSISSMEEDAGPSILEVMFAELCLEWLEHNAIRVLNAQMDAAKNKKPPLRRQNASSSTCVKTMNKSLIYSVPRSTRVESRCSPPRKMS